MRKQFSTCTLEKLAQYPSDWPEAEYLLVSAYLGYQENYQTGDPHDGKNYASMAVAIITQSSRGNVSINSSRMSDPTLINPNWLTNPADIELALAIFKRQRQLWDELTRLNVTIRPEASPGTQVQSDEDILYFIRQLVIEIWHASATCKMGRATDSMAVVDSHARVYGTNGLRVVDISIFPFLPTGHPQATVYMIAEKIAAAILSEN